MGAVRLLLLIAVATLSLPLQAAVEFIWHDRFSNSEQQKITTWVADTVSGVEALVGPFPFAVEIHMYRRDGAREPVPWANTRRGSVQGVNFHVDPDFSLQKFRSDWTAPHELSHLIFPYLGRNASWFAEGFASFMQYQVMIAMGVMGAEQAQQRYLARLDRARNNYPFEQMPFPDSAADLRASGRYPTMYWGGAAYFLQVDEQLRSEHGSNLIEVLERYLSCCRRHRKNLDTLIKELDRVSETSVFSSTLTTFLTTPGFPSYQMLD